MPKSISKNRKVDAEALRIAFEKLECAAQDALNESDCLFEQCQTLRNPKDLADV